MSKFLFVLFFLPTIILANNNYSDSAPPGGIYDPCCPGACCVGPLSDKADIVIRANERNMAKNPNSSEISVIEKPSYSPKHDEENS